MTTQSMGPCADDSDLLRLADGELSVNETDRLRAHAATCVHCAHSLTAIEALVADVRAPAAAIQKVDDVAMVAALMRRIDRESTIPSPRTSRTKRVIAFAGASILVAAVALVPRAHDTEGTFAARGEGSPMSLRKAVSVTFTTRTMPPRDLQNGAIFGKNELIGASYSNVRTAAPTYLLAFAIDSAHAVHWLYPAYETAGTDPESVSLLALGRPTTMPTSVLLDGPSLGPMRLVALLSEEPHHVSEIESLPPSAMTMTALRSRFSEAVIDQTVVNVAAAPASPSSH